MYFTEEEAVFVGQIADKNASASRLRKSRSGQDREDPIQVETHAVSLKFIGANPEPQLHGINPLGGEPTGYLLKFIS